METSYIISALGLFGTVIVLFALFQLGMLSRRKKRAEAARAEQGMEDVADQVSFRDEMMVRFDARLAKEALDLSLRPSEAISFKIGPAGGDEEAMLVVLANLYTGCAEHPDHAEAFKAHFIDDLLQTVTSKFA